MSDTPDPRAAGVSKSFGAVQALYEVDFHVSRRRGHGPRRRQRRRQVDADQVHRRHPPDRRGRDPLRRASRSRIHGPKDAAALGHRDRLPGPRAGDNLDVVQNMFLGREELDALPPLDETTMEKRAARRSATLSVTTIRSVRQTVAGLSGGQRQSVAVAKAVMWNSKVVILDEPTAALGVAQTRQVLDLVKRLGEQGLARDADLAQPARHLRGRRHASRCCASARTSPSSSAPRRPSTQVVEAITAGAAVEGARRRRRR